MYAALAGKQASLTAGSNISITTDSSTGKTTIASSYTDTKNTAGSTDTSSKIYLVGATTQAANSQTYSQDTCYVGTDGCLYSNSTKVLTAHQDLLTLVYPVGSIYMSIVDTSPGSFLGGSWTKIVNGLILPFGDAPLAARDTTIPWGLFSGKNYKVRGATGGTFSSAADICASSDGGFCTTNAAPSGNPSTGIVFGNAWASLNDSTSGVKVYAWKRMPESA